MFELNRTAFNKDSDYLNYNRCVKKIIPGDRLFIYTNVSGKMLTSAITENTIDTTFLGNCDGIPLVGTTTKGTSFWRRENSCISLDRLGAMKNLNNFEFFWLVYANTIRIAKIIKAV